MISGHSKPGFVFVLASFTIIRSTVSHCPTANTASRYAGPEYARAKQPRRA